MLRVGPIKSLTWKGNLLPTAVEVNLEMDPTAPTKLSKTTTPADILIATQWEILNQNHPAKNLDPWKLWNRMFVVLTC